MQRVATQGQGHRAIRRVMWLPSGALELVDRSQPEQSGDGIESRSRLVDQPGIREIGRVEDLAVVLFDGGGETVVQSRVVVDARMARPSLFLVQDDSQA